LNVDFVIFSDPPSQMNFNDIADIDSIRLDTPIASDSVPRWQRKAAAAAARRAASTSENFGANARLHTLDASTHALQGFVHHHAGQDAIANAQGEFFLKKKKKKKKRNF
jgi:hypothetical protein